MAGDESALGRHQFPDVLRAEAASLGALTANNILLDAGDATALLKHVLVDEYGILVIERNECEGAVRGTSGGRAWTGSMYGHKSRFANPLRQNDRAREVLQRLLVASGRDIPARYVQSLVVFAAADLSKLRLDKVDALRVIPQNELIDFIRARSDFPPNEGGLDRTEVADLISFLTSLDRSRSADVVAWHARETASATKRFELRRPKRPDRAPMSTAAQVIFQGENRYPDGSLPERLPPKRSASSARLAVLVAILLGVLALWLFAAGGIETVEPVVTRIIDDPKSAWTTLIDGRATDPGVTPAPNRPTPTPVAYDPRLADQRLKDAAPVLYERVINRGAPRVSETKGLPTFTYDYISGSGQKGSISIVLDAKGRIVGVNR